MELSNCKQSAAEDVLGYDSIVPTLEKLSLLLLVSVILEELTFGLALYVLPPLLWLLVRRLALTVDTFRPVLM